MLYCLFVKFSYALAAHIKKTSILKYTIHYHSNDLAHKKTAVKNGS